MRLERFGLLVAIALGLSSTQQSRGVTIFVPTDQPTIQAAIDVAADGCTIIVEPGEYHETINLLGKGLTLRSAGGADVTTINGSGFGDSVVRIISGEAQDTVIEGFTITGGDAVHGGGMRIVMSDPTILSCRLVSNFASGAGGPDAGGGGGIYNDTSSPTLINCIFKGNSTDGDGGAGMYSRNSSPLLVNCLFGANHSLNNGGAVYDRHGSSSQLLNCTIAANTADDRGGGLFVADTSSMEVVSSIVWDNDAIREGSQVYLDGGGELSATHSCIEGNWAGSGNIDLDPMFRCPNGDSGPDTIWCTSDDLLNLRLQAGSPCIDAGDSTSMLDGVNVDLDGNGRLADHPSTTDVGVPVGIMSTTIDMGAYELPTSFDPADVNVDGRVDSLDLLLLLAAWGGCP